MEEEYRHHPFLHLRIVTAAEIGKEKRAAILVKVKEIYSRKEKQETTPLSLFLFPFFFCYSNLELLFCIINGCN